MEPEPPQARRREEGEDPWGWLRDDARSDPAVRAHLEAENRYAAARMAATEPLRRALYDEMLGRILETDRSVPAPLGPWEYYERTVAGRQYPLHCRRPRGADDRDERVLLDENALAADGGYLHVGAIRVSPDQRLLAYAVDRDGAERYEIRVRDLDTGQDLPDRVPGADDALEWSADGASLFYASLDAAHRPDRVLCHRLGTPPERDRLLFEEPDPAFHAGLDRTADRRFVVLQLDSSITSEVHLLPADRPDAGFRLVAARRRGVEYGVEHWNGRLLILTNDGATNFRLMEAPLDATDPARWRERVPHDPETMLEGLDLFRDHLVLTERRDGVRGLRVFSLPGWVSRRVPFDEPVRVVATFDNLEYETDRLRFAYESPVTPRTVYDCHLPSGRLERLKVREIPGGYDPQRFVCERRHATSSDGTRVPISLVRPRDLPLDGGAPCLLYGYGAYGITVEPGFDSNRISLLDRGFVYAIAHVRGGGALGRRWYEDGKLARKGHSFDDFIACAERLIELGYTSPARLAIRGGSAGGLLVGAVLNRRPELFRAAVAKVPFVDVLNTMLDATLPLTAIEWDEWGDPRDPAARAVIAGYSPYDNVQARRYPDLLVTAGLNDPRVAYWEPAKWVARLRATADPSGEVLLKTDLGAGHGGASGRYERLKEAAFEAAFVIDRLSRPRPPEPGGGAGGR